MNKQQIKSALHNYRWMIETIALRRKEMETDAGERIIGQYGIESTLPKPQGDNTDPIYFEVVRREKEWNGISKLQKKVVYIQRRFDRVTNEKEKAVFNQILNGKSLRAISRQLNIPFSNVRRIRDSIVDQLCESNGSNGSKNTQLQKENAIR